MTTNDKIKEKVKSMTPEQLEAVKLGILSVIEAIDRQEEPQIGDRCIFWNDDKTVYTVDFLEALYIDRLEEYRYKTQGGRLFKNCKRLTREAE